MKITAQYPKINIDNHYKYIFANLHTNGLIYVYIPIYLWGIYKYISNIKCNLEYIIYIENVSIISVYMFTLYIFYLYSYLLTYIFYLIYVNYSNKIITSKTSVKPSMKKYISYILT